MDEKQKLKLVNFVILRPQNQVTDPFFPLRDFLASFDREWLSSFVGIRLEIGEARYSIDTSHLQSSGTWIRAPGDAIWRKREKIQTWTL